MSLERKVRKSMMIVVLGSWEPFTKLTDIRKSREDVGCNCKQMKLDKLIVVKLGQEVQPDAASSDPS
jgi:hypothetical protein